MISAGELGASSARDSGKKAARANMLMEMTASRMVERRSRNALAA